jgi:transcription elongation factor GreA
MKSLLKIKNKMKTILTKEGKQKLQDELNFLSTVEKARAISDLTDARESGTLEENTQYLIAKDEYEKLQSRIDKLQMTLSNSVVVDSSEIKTDKVAILTTVKVLNITNNKEMIFSIVPDNEIDIKSGKISTSSPIGSGLLGKSLNEVCDVKTPAGVFKFKILDISI